MKKWMALSLVVLLSWAAPARAASADDSLGAVYDELVRLNPGVTVAEMRTAVQEYAEESGEADEQVARDALAEARANGLGDAKGDPAQRSSGSGGGDESKKPLPKATTGDIFWWDSKTDHVGLYTGGATVTHAPGVGKVVSVVRVQTLQGPVHTELMLVNSKDDGTKRIAGKKRAVAAKWAESKEGKPYNKNFAFNKKIDASTYNCSQLVWAAWKVAGDIDLDNGISKGVYPGDIRGDRRTHVYRKSI